MIKNLTTLNKIIYILGIIFIIFILIINFTRIQSPFGIEGWYKCMDTKDTYLLIGDDIYAIINEKENTSPILGTFKKEDDSNTPTMEYNVLSDKWTSGVFVYYRLSKKINLIVYYQDNQFKSWEYKKMVYAPNISIHK